VHVFGHWIPNGLLLTIPIPGGAFVTNDTVNGNVMTVVLNVAVTDTGAFIVTVQLLVPVQAPLQPANVEPELGAAVSVTCDPLLKFAVQPLPQLIPDGLLVTVPAPVPAFVTVNANEVGLNVAVTDCAAVIFTVQTPTPEQPDGPVQPVNVLPLFGVAISVTVEPAVNGTEHVLGHKIPAGLLDTVPVPVPASVTVNTEVGLKVAVIVSAAFTVTVQTPVPVQPCPNQPANTELAPAAAVNVTCVPLA
jgi:hypothetical protein